MIGQDLANQKNVRKKWKKEHLEQKKLILDLKEMDPYYRLGTADLFIFY